jgi:drug/metabolite transporter (DMT)-like permease
VGEAAALGSAFLWALSNILMGSQSARVPAAVISALRCLFAALFLGAIVAVMALAGAVRLPNISAALGLAGSGTLGMAVGDTLYIRSLGHVGVNRALPISTALYPLVTFALAVALLGERLSVMVAAGAALIVIGVMLIVTAERLPSAIADGNPREARIGLGRVVLASVLWACASVWLRSSADGVQPALAQAVRLPVAAIVTVLVARGAGNVLAPARYGRRSIGALFLTGVLGTGVGSILFVIAVQHAGAARTAVLSSTAPLFALPMAAMMLGERVTPRVLVGTALSIAGIWLVV